MRYKTITDKFNGVLIQRKLLVRSFDELSAKEIEYLQKVSGKTIDELQKEYRNKDFTIEDFEDIQYTQREITKLISVKVW